MLLGDIVRLNAQKSPDRPALIVDGREISFGRLYERSLRLANALLGVAGKGDRIGILAENVPEYVEAYYGVPAAGMALTFLNYRLNPKEWAYILNNAEARRPAGRPRVRREDRTGALRDRLDQARDRHRRFGRRRTRVVRRLRRRRASSQAAGRGRRGRHRLADLHQRHHRVPEGSDAHAPQPGCGCARVGDRVPAEPDERTLMAFPLCHVAGYIVPVTHMRGGLIALMRAYEPEQWMRLVDEYRITGGSLAPTMVNFLLQHPKIREYDLSSLTRHRLRRGSHAGRGVALRDRSFRADRVLRLRDDRARGKRAHVPEGGARPAPSKATSTSSRRAARRCASPTSRSSTKT